MAGGGGSPGSPVVVAVKLTGASQVWSDSWNDSKLLNGDVLLQVSTDGVVLGAPFAGGKAGLQRELRKLYNTAGGVRLKVRRGQAVVEVRAKVVLDEGTSLLKSKTYVLASLSDSTHIASLVDSTEQECLTLQDRSRKILEASRSSREFSKREQLTAKLSSMRLKDNFVSYPWEQKMQAFLPVSGSAMVFSLLLMPNQVRNAREFDALEDTSARGIAWLSAAQASGVPITFVNIQTEPFLMQFAEYNQLPAIARTCGIGNSGSYRIQDREGMDVDVVRAVRLWYVPAAAELAIDLKPEENEARLGVGISCTEEGFCHVSSVDPGTVADRAGLRTVYQAACAAGKLLVISRLAGEKITPWMVSSSGSIRCFDTISLSDKLSLHRQTGHSVRLHVMVWDGGFAADPWLGDALHGGDLDDRKAVPSSDYYADPSKGTYSSTDRHQHKPAAYVNGRAIMIQQSKA